MALSVISETVKGYLNKMNQAAYRSLLGTALQNTQNFLTTTNAQAKAGTADKAVLASNLLQGAPTISAGTLKPCFVEHYQIPTAAAASATAVHAAITLGASAADVSTAITNPDFPRIVTVKGNAAGIAGNVVITGTNIAGAAITETIALNEATEVLGTKAFKTVTNINVPAKTNGSGDTVSIGIGSKFGYPHIIADDQMVLVHNFNNATDAGTTTVDNDELEKNLYAIAGTADGAKPIDLVYLV